MARTTALPQGPDGGGDWGAKGTKQMRARVAAFAPPWIVWLLLPPVSGLCHLVWGENPVAAPWFSAGVLVATLLLAGWTWLLAAARSDQIRALSSVTTIAAGLWFMCAGIVGPFTRPTIDLWAAGGVVGCLFWTFRRAMLAQKGQTTVASGAAAKFMTLLDGARIGKSQVIDGAATPVVEAKVEVDRGRQTVADLQKKAEDMETTLGLRRGAVAVDYDYDAADAGAAVVRFAPVNPLAAGTLWTGPDRPGASIAEPIRIGSYETGAPAVIYLPGDADIGRNLAQWLIGGVNGAGKTEAFRTIAANALCRSEVSFMVSDPRKAIQFLKPFLDEGVFERVALTEPGGRALADALDAAITKRAAYLGQHGYKQWAPGCGLNLLVAWFEEALWLAQSSKLLKLVVAARSAGIVIAVSLQRPSHSSMDTDTRAQLTGQMCFGVEGADDAGMVLPEQVINAGASPEQWLNHQPGCAYVVAPGIPQKLHAVPLRFDWPKQDAVIAAALRQWAHVRTPLDEVTRQAMAPWWEKIEAGNGDIIGESDAAPTTRLPAETPAGPAAIVVDPDDVDDGDFGDDEPDDGQSCDDDLPPIGPPIEPDIADPDAPIGDPPAGTEDFRFGSPPPARKLSTEEARAVVQQHLRTALEQGKSQVTAAEVDAMKPETTRTRSWIRLEMLRLCEQAEPGEIGLSADLDAPKPGTFDLRAPAAALAGAR